MKPIFISFYDNRFMFFLQKNIFFLLISVFDRSMINNIIQRGRFKAIFMPIINYYLGILTMLKVQYRILNPHQISKSKKKIY